MIKYKLSKINSKTMNTDLRLLLNFSNSFTIYDANILNKKSQVNPGFLIFNLNN